MEKKNRPGLMKFKGVEENRGYIVVLLIGTVLSSLCVSERRKEKSLQVRIGNGRGKVGGRSFFGR